jgi:hypothetical protein
VTDNKTITDGVLNLPEVDGDDLMTLFFPDGFNDQTALLLHL